MTIKKEIYLNFKEKRAAERQKVLDSFVWVKLNKDFSIVRETLTRIGLPSYYDKNGEPIKDKELIQTCHILHKSGRYAIAHFKEMFMLDGKRTTFNDEDRQRRNTIIQLMIEWDMISPEDETKIQDQIPINRLKVVPFSERDEWKFVSKYVVDRSKFKVNNV